MVKEKKIRAHGKMGRKIKLKPCPFCGGEVKIVVCDRIGNLCPEEYENDPSPRLGLGYMLEYAIKDKGDYSCPIAHQRGEVLGAIIYDTREEAAELWNKRKFWL